MMPDLGKYAATVLSAYGISLVLIAGVIVLSMVQSRRAKHKLKDAEARLRHD